MKRIFWTWTKHVVACLLVAMFPATALAGFTNVTDQAGLTKTDIRSGAAWGDYDRDGCVDLFISGRDANTLFRNNCNGTFSDVTSIAGISGAPDGKGVAWGDYDRDGDLDLYVGSKGGANALYRNNGDGTFTDVAAAAGVADARQTAGVAWGDYDADGDLDIFVANRFTDATVTDRRDALYRNNGDGTFTDVADMLGVAGTSDRKTFMGMWFDYNQDRHLDLYLAVDRADGSIDFADDVLYRNNGDGTFTDVTRLLLGNSQVWEPQHAMGLAIGDSNGDGCLDIFATNNTDPHDPNFSGNPFPEFRRSVLHVNNCDETFTIQSNSAGIPDRNMVEWGANFIDYDNDGDQDLSIVAGGTLTSGEPNVLLQNNGSGVYSDVTDAEGVQDNGAAWGSAWADYDNDGDLDWVVVNQVGAASGTIVLFRNDGPAGNHLKVNLHGSQSNKDGVGARVELTAGGQTQVRFIHAGESYLSAQEPAAFFGLGTAATADAITVRWPNGLTDQVFDVAANQTIDLFEGGVSLGECSGTVVSSATGEPLDGARVILNLDGSKVSSMRTGADGEYVFPGLSPTMYDVKANKVDYKAQTLQCSVQSGAQTIVNFALNPQVSGTTITFTDVTVDAGVSGEQFQGATGHSLGVNWIDYNNDNWPDLFLVNGFDFQAHLYRNNGDGTFTHVNELLPPLPNVEMSGSRFGDFDRDGDVDIFIAADNEVFELDGTNPHDGPANLLLKNLWMENGGQVIAGQPLFEEIGALAMVQDLADPPLGATYPARRTKTMGLFDFDRDGCLDVFWGQMTLGVPGDEANRNSLFRNRCDGTFEDVTDISGMHAGADPTIYYRPTLAFGGMHLDGDLWPDMYVCNVHEESPFHHDVIYQNNGDGTFTDITGLSPGVGDDAGSCMGFDAADIDRNGTWDVYMSDVFHTENDADPKGNPLYLGNGDGTFQDNSAVAAGVDADFSWGVNFFDVDLDGWEDLFVATKPENAFLYKNNKDGTFTNVGIDAGLLTPIDLRGSATADYDRDGDLDLAMVKHGNNGKFLLYRNDTTTTGHSLELKLKGVQSNPDAIGALIKVTAKVGDPLMMRQVKGGSSAHSQDDLVVHFGVGRTRTIAEVQIFWPSGVVDVLTDVAADQLVTVVEGSTVP